MLIPPHMTAPHDPSYPRFIAFLNKLPTLRAMRLLTWRRWAILTASGATEPNCWPHPLDIMAIHALYQQDC